jgi:hypothetical protein
VIWILGFGSWDLDLGIWDLEFGFWNLDLGIWILGFAKSADNLMINHCSNLILLIKSLKKYR